MQESKDAADRRCQSMEGTRALSVSMTAFRFSCGRRSFGTLMRMALMATAKLSGTGTTCASPSSPFAAGRGFPSVG
jgi:hypothetical protein